MRGSTHKKLIELGQWWARVQKKPAQLDGATKDKKIKAEAKGLGLDDEFLAFQAKRKAARQASSITSAQFVMWPEHINIYQLFHKLRRQFVVISMGGYFGIPITAKESLFNIEQIPLEQRSQLLDDIQLVEDGALQVMNQKDD